MIVQKAFKFRIYPNHSQQAELAKQFGAVRFVYNHYRAVREGFYLDTGTGLNYDPLAESPSPLGVGWIATALLRWTLVERDTACSSRVNRV